MINEIAFNLYTKSISQWIIIIIIITFYCLLLFIMIILTPKIKRNVLFLFLSRFFFFFTTARMIIKKRILIFIVNSNGPYFCGFLIVFRDLVGMRILIISAYWLSMWHKNNGREIKESKKLNKKKLFTIVLIRRNTKPEFWQLVKFCCIKVKKVIFLGFFLFSEIIKILAGNFICIFKE